MVKLEDLMLSLEAGDKSRVAQWFGPPPKPKASEQPPPPRGRTVTYDGYVTELMVARAAMENQRHMAAILQTRGAEF